MNASTLNRFTALLVSLLAPICLSAAPKIDMTDPRRALGREDDVRVDAQLLQDTVSPGGPLGVTYQIQNFTKVPVAVAEKICAASYDSDSRTITLAIGSEVPIDGAMPRLSVINPGEKKTFTTGATLRIAVAATRSPFSATPRFVQIKVSVLRDLDPFRELIVAQAKSPNPAPVALSDAQFESWLESNDTIYLNALPVQFEAKGRGALRDVAERSGSFGGR